MNGTTAGDPLQSRFDGLHSWKQGDRRAPHKPLLVFYYAFGRRQRDDAGDLPLDRLAPGAFPPWLAPSRMWNIP